MKKIAFLISGNIRIYEKNFIFLDSIKKILKDYEIIFISSVWQNQVEIDEFTKKYQIKFINQLEEKDWSHKIKEVKYVTGEENLSWKLKNIFHMWYAITENIKFLEDVVSKNNIKIDYVCRFRTDITTLKEIKNFQKDLLNIHDNEILLSSNRHFRGITDLFFIANYQTFLKIKNIMVFFDQFSKQERVFNPEYVFYCFLNENNFKIKIAYQLEIAIIRIEEAKPTKEAHIPFKDKINMKIAKRKIKFMKILNKLRYIWN